MISVCARAASARGILSPITGRNAPFSSPGDQRGMHLAYSASDALISVTPRMSASRAIVSRGLISTGPAVADHRYATFLRQHGQIAREVLVRQQLDDHVDALALCQLHQLVQISFGRVIERRATRSLLLHQLDSSSLPAVPITIIPAARASCTAAVPTPPLAPCTSTVSARLGVGALKQPAIRGAIRNSHRGTLLEADVVGQVVHLGMIGQRLLGIGSRRRCGDVNAIAGLHPLHAAPDGRDYSSGIRSPACKAGWV